MYKMYKILHYSYWHRYNHRKALVCQTGKYSEAHCPRACCRGPNCLSRTPPNWFLPVDTETLCKYPGDALCRAPNCACALHEGCQIRVRKALRFLPFQEGKKAFAPAVLPDGSDQSLLQLYFSVSGALNPRMIEPRGLNLVALNPRRIEPRGLNPCSIEPRALNPED